LEQLFKNTSGNTNTPNGSAHNGRGDYDLING